MREAATQYRDLYKGMIGNKIKSKAHAKAVIKELRNAKAAFEKVQGKFIALAKEMIDVNERFCSFPRTYLRHKMHLKSEWKALRWEVMEY